MVPSVAPFTSNPKHCGLLRRGGIGWSHVVEAVACLADALLVAGGRVSEHVYVGNVDAARTIVVLSILVLRLAEELRVHAASHGVAVCQHHALRAWQLAIVEHIRHLAARSPAFALLRPIVEGVTALASPQRVALHSGLLTLDFLASAFRASALVKAFAEGRL